MVTLLNMIGWFILALIWNSKDTPNFILKLILGGMFLLNLLHLLRFYGVRIF